MCSRLRPASLWRLIDALPEISCWMRLASSALSRLKSVGRLPREGTKPPLKRVRGSSRGDALHEKTLAHPLSVNPRPPNSRTRLLAGPTGIHSRVTVFRRKGAVGRA